MPAFSYLQKSTFLTGVFLSTILLLFSGCALFEPAGSSLQHFHTVVIDAGHGGYDSGAPAISGASEKNLTLDIAQRLKPLLEQHGYHVILTRTNDTFITLGTRIAISNAHPDAIFVSIHFNSSPSRAASGIEAYCYNRSSEPLAMNICRELSSVYICRYRGVKHACYYVLHHNNRPATLLELGFLSNRRENAIVQNPKIRQELAQKIATGITNCQPNRNGSTNPKKKSLAVQ